MNTEIQRLVYIYIFIILYVVYANWTPTDNIIHEIHG